MRIFLLGFMGSGKTTIGKKLSEKLSYQFFDLDNIIEEETQMKIDEIFYTKGEFFFREIEKNELEKMFLKDNYVLSLGGGTPCFNNNMERMNESGITIYLQLTAEELFNRIIRFTEEEKNTRPLIAGKNNDELLKFINDLLLHRESYYKQSKIIIPNATDKIEDTLNSIVKKIKDNQPI